MALRNDLNAQTKSDLVAYNGATDGQAYILLGETTMGDSPCRIYYYSASSSATVDGEDVLSATGMGVGRFIKSPFPSYSLPNVGTAGTYGKVTTDSQGRVTSGKRVETYSGTTNGSGNYTVTFGTAYSVAPNIQANIVGGTNTNLIKITSVSTTGFTVNVVNRTDVVGLLPTYAVVNGASVDVLITEK